MAESSAKPRRYAPRMPPEERREQLLDATLGLIADQGYEAVSMEGIARKAGVTKPVVYDLFGSLADLLEALLEREEERALNQLAELMPTPAEDADPAKVLVDGLDAFLRAIETRPDAWRLSLMPSRPSPGSSASTSSATGPRSPSSSPRSCAGGSSSSRCRSPTSTCSSRRSSHWPSRAGA